MQIHAPKIPNSNPKKKKKNHPNQLSQTPGIPIQMGPTKTDWNLEQFLQNKIKFQTLKTQMINKINSSTWKQNDVEHFQKTKQANPKTMVVQGRRKGRKVYDTAAPLWASRPWQNGRTERNWEIKNNEVVICMLFWGIYIFSSQIYIKNTIDFPSF